MIRKTLGNTKNATCLIEIQAKNPEEGFASGTGFFVSENGYFVTAEHIFWDDDFELDLEKITVGNRESCGVFEKVKIVKLDKDFDFALLKIEKENVKFSHINISSRILDEGEPVYYVAYPTIQFQRDSKIESYQSNTSTVTSAIVSGYFEYFDGDSIFRRYSLDNGSIYGMSGGPIISSETGNVHAILSEFKPIYIEQQHMSHPDTGDTYTIATPSINTNVVNLSHPKLLQYLSEYDIPIFDS